MKHLLLKANISIVFISVNKRLNLQKMNAIFIIIVSCLVFEVNCWIDHKVIEDRVRRQATEKELCVRNKFESYPSNSLCMMATEGGRVLSATQEEFDDIFKEICSSECQSLILEADDDCGVYEDSPGLRDFFVGLCKMNNNGLHCYELYSNASDFVSNTEVDCFFGYSAIGFCNCQSELTSAVDMNGCCLNVYHEYYETLFEGFSYNATDLYMNQCSVTLPDMCSKRSSLTPSPTSETPATSDMESTGSATGVTRDTHFIVLPIVLLLALF